MQLTPEQSQLAETVDRFVKKRYSREQWRAATDLAAGPDPDSWREIAELGWLGLGFAEEDGGIGGTAADRAVLMERLGAGLVPDPYVSTAVIGAGLLSRHGSPAQRADLARIAAGELKLALAATERQGRYDAAAVTLAATAVEGGWRLEGEKRVVLDAPQADRLIVSARTDAGITLFMVAADAQGITRRDYPTVDRRRASDIRFAGCTVGAGAALGPVGGGLPLLADAAALAIAALANESVGIMQVLLDTTAGYLKVRTQFGKVLATLQVLQHRMIDMFAAIEEARAAALIATLAADRPAIAMREIHVAKIKIGQAGRQVGQAAIQLHGAIGMTDEYLVGDYVKRLEAIDFMFGNADHHLRALARS